MVWWAIYPKKYKDNMIHPHMGKFLMPVLNSKSLSIQVNDDEEWEFFEMKAFIKEK
jgi:hypothetical protein